MQRRAGPAGGHGTGVRPPRQPSHGRRGQGAVGGGGCCGGLSRRCAAAAAADCGAGRGEHAAVALPAQYARERERPALSARRLLVSQFAARSQNHFIWMLHRTPSKG